ncbi:MAG: hypothetical protein ABIH42_04045, partial [Planctomycetota bacterium]
CADVNGNIYVSGCFEETVNFAVDWNDFDTKTSVGGGDVFVTKIENSGTYGLSYRIGGTSEDDVSSIFVDNSGAVFITGTFEGEIDFAQDFGVIDRKTSTGNKDIFITKILP